MDQLLLLKPHHQTTIFHTPPGKVKKDGSRATILSASLGFKDITFDKYTFFEYHSIIFNSRPVLCIIVHRPPKRCSSFVFDFSEVLSIIHTNYELLFYVILTSMWTINQTLLPWNLLNLLNCVTFTYS